MKISDKGLDFIKQFEGFSETPYKCPAGIPTQGYGHTESIGPPNIGGSWDRDYALKVLEDDINREISGKITRSLPAHIMPDITQGMFDAMCSLAYNIGISAFLMSSVFKYVCSGNFDYAAEKFELWNKASGKLLPGLASRRKKERDIFLGVL